MANTINVTYKVNEDGSLEKISQKANKAAKATDNLNNSKNRYNKQEKGAAGLTSNSTKAFAKQAQTLNGGGGLVAAYATLAANVFAITAAFGVLQRAAGIQQLEQGLIFTGRAAGQNLPMVVDRLRDITDGAIAAADAMTSVAMGISAGFSESQLEGLTRVARGASLALGRDMTDAMNRLIRGAAKLEPEILDELGIMVRLDDTAREYAATLGKTANELTQFEKRMAFTNAIIDQGNVKFGALSKVVEANPYDRLSASFDGLTKTLLNFINEGLKPIAGFLADNITAVLGVFSGLAAQTINVLLPALTGAGKKMAELATESANTAKENIANVKSFASAPKEYKKLTKAIQEGTASEKDMQKAKTSLTRSIDMHNRQMETFTQRHGAGSEAVKEKTAKLNASKLALKNITNAETQATIATQLNTRATALNAAAHGSLREMLATLKLAWVGEIASTNASTASKGFLTRALVFLRTGFSLAMLSVKAFGIALLQAIPVIGQIILVGTIAYDLLKDFFVTPSNALDKELERVQERLEEFPKVINQMANAYLVATSRVEKFVAAFNPLVGLTAQTAGQLQSLISVQMAENLGNQVAKTKELFKAEEKLEKARAAQKKAKEKPGFSQFAGVAESVNVARADANVAALEAEVKRLSTAGIDTEKTIEGAKATMIGYSASLQTAQAFLEAGSSEYTLYSKAIANSDSVLNLLNKGSLKEAIALHQKSTMALQQEQEALKGVKDATADIDAFFKKAQEPVGFFAERINLLKKSLNNLVGKEISPEIVTLYSSLDQFKGITFPKLKSGDILSPEETSIIQAQVLTLVKEFERLDKRAMDLKIAANSFKIDDINAERKYGQDSGKAKVVALENEQIMQTESIILEQDRLRLIEEGTVAFDNQLLVVQKLLLAQEQLNAKKVEAAMGATGTTAERIETAVSSGGFGEANDREKIAIMQNMVAPMTEELAKLGPEGELINAVVQGAFTMADSFTEAFDKMGKGTFTLSDGLSMASSAVGALASIQAAQSKAAIAGVDREIAAEKARDGKSAQSIAKLSQLEKKKESMKRKAFEQDKKMKLAQAIISTALGINQALASAPAPFNFILAGLVGAMGMAQVGIIQGMTYQGGSAGSVPGPSKISVGNRQNSVDFAKARSPSGEQAYARGSAGTGSGMTNYTPAFTGMKYRASGGNTGFMVGEQGPEIFTPDRPGRITPADEVGKMSAPVNVNFTIQAIDTQGMEQALMNQRGSLIGMIREAANAHGENFLESINTEALTREKF